jgi:hypothetical protein
MSIFSRLKINKISYFLFIIYVFIYISRIIYNINESKQNLNEKNNKSLEPSDFDYLTTYRNIFKNNEIIKIEKKISIKKIINN